MAQAHRIKSKPPVTQVSVFRFLPWLLRELGFWTLAGVALGMAAALFTYSPADPAWTHTATVARLHNLGGVVGAWFADVTLYFFGYAAYLLPLGVAFAGWRLCKRGALLELDGEIVLLRMLGFLVSLGTVCGLVALHFASMPGLLPGSGSPGGLVGLHVSQFLFQAFQFLGANLFLVLLLLAGGILTTGLSWLAVMDWIGSVVINAVDWLGGLIMAPFQRGRAKLADASAKKTRIKTATPPAAPSQKTEPSQSTRAPVTPSALGAVHSLRDWMSRLGQVVDERWTAWREQRTGTVTGPEELAEDEAAPAPSISPPQHAAQPSVAPSPLHAQHGARIEPVLGLPLAGSPVAHSPAVAAAPLTAGLALPASDLTLVPSVVPALAKARAKSPPPPPVAVVATVADEHAPQVEEPAEARSWPDDFDLAPVAEPPAQPVVPPRIAVSDTVAVPGRLAPLAASPSLPPLDLLDPPTAHIAGYSPETLEQMSRRVEILLRHFGIAVEVVAVEPGPVITRFEVEPAPGVKVSQISNLAKDLARGLSVISVRVVEIIPGKPVVGLEIPNQQREIVYLREVLESPVYSQAASPLTLALGKDISGNPIMANLAKMPHLLVAGTTGSGKSVAINAMLLSLLYKAGPREVRLILVDPKMLELSMYEDIPHLLTPVVTDMKEAANALRWCVAEMDRRYRLMAALKVRNIAGFNRRLADAEAEGESIADPLWKPEEGRLLADAPALQPLPFIVVVIDELADMMMIVGKKVEELIARLAQKARAAGIHLILATQRPSVDVITGLIKANIPTRIAFQVSSRVDSRTILDQMGAEQLLGHGDMLYLPPGTGLPQRVHGAFVDDHEVPRVVDFLRQTGAPDYIDEVLAGVRDEGDGLEELDNGGRGGEGDPLYDDAVRIVTESRRASVSGVQRRLRIGYNRAARLVEEMEAAGVVGPLQSNGSREVIAPGPP